MPRLLKASEHLNTLKALQRVREKYRGDPEGQHYEGDQILRGVLSAMGYKGIVEEYDKLSKWYA